MRMDLVVYMVFGSFGLFGIGTNEYSDVNIEFPSLKLCCLTPIM